MLGSKSVGRGGEGGVDGCGINRNRLVTTWIPHTRTLVVCGKPNRALKDYHCLPNRDFWQDFKYPLQRKFWEGCNNEYDKFFFFFLLKDYRIAGRMGEGTFSEVLKCQSLVDGKMYACKRMKQKYSK